MFVVCFLENTVFIVKLSTKCVFHKFVAHIFFVQKLFATNVFKKYRITFVVIILLQKILQQLFATILLQKLLQNLFG